MTSLVEQVRSSLFYCSQDFLFETEAELRPVQRVYHLRIGLLTPSSSLLYLEELHHWKTTTFGLSSFRANTNCNCLRY